MHPHSDRRQFLLQSAVFFASLAAGVPLLRAGWAESSPLPGLAGFGLTGFGLTGNLPNLKGKVVYLDFWASWCAPCKASFPVLNQWQQQYAAKGFTVLGVSVDDNEAEMDAFLKKLPVSFPVVRDAAHRLVAAADVSTMPTSFLIDRKGIVRHAQSGFHPKDAPALAAQIATLLSHSA